MVEFEMIDCDFWRARRNQRKCLNVVRIVVSNARVEWNVFAFEMASVFLQILGGPKAL